MTSEDQYSIFDNPHQFLRSDIFDESGKEVGIGDKVELLFNKGEFSEHKAVFEVIWKDAAYKIKSVGTGNESFLGSISHNAHINII